MKTRYVRLYEILRKPTTIGLALVYIICIALACRFFVYGTDGINVLYMYARYFYFPAMILTVLTYLSGITSFRSHTDEVLSAKKYPGYYQTRVFLFILGYALFLLASLLVILLILSASNDITDYFFTYFGKSYIYNLVLPLLISLGVAYLTSRMGSGIGSAVVLVLFLLLTSPVFTNLVWYTKPAFPIDQILEAILRPFRIFYENGAWIPSVLVGMQTGPSRGSLLFFWIIFLTAAICFSLLRRRVLKWAVFSVLAMASLCFLIYACLPSGGYQRVDEVSWNGTMGDYISYYSEQPVGIEYDNINYAFTDYDLKLNFSRDLAVEARLQLHSNTPATQFEFTLYHDYHIRSLNGEDVSVTWSQNGDIVTLTTQEPITDCTLLLSYRGGHKIFFADGDGAMLPGWFPWYPMAGQRQVILNFETFPSCYNVYNRINSAHISIKTESSLQTVSNLKKTGDSTFEGTGDSITLIGGKLVPLSDGQVKDCIPMELYEDTETWSNSLVQQWQDICDTLKLYGLELPTEEDSKILVAAEEMGRFGSDLNRFAIFDDYILTCGSGMNIDTVSKELFLRYNSDSYLASILCSWGGLMNTPEETCSYWLGFLQAGAADHPLEISLKETLEAANAAGKGGEAVQKIAQFLCEEGAAGNEQAFLEGLRDQYDSN